MTSLLQTMGVYRIVCLPTGAAYVGASSDIPKRFASHRRLLREGRHINTALQQLWSIHGSAAFSFEIVERVPSRPELKDAEKRWSTKEANAINRRSLAGSYRWDKPVRPSSTLCVRLSDEEVEDALKKGREYGQHDISKVVRLALKLLPYPKKR